MKSRLDGEPTTPGEIEFVQRMADIKRERDLRLAADNWRALLSVVFALLFFAMLGVSVWLQQMFGTWAAIAFGLPMSFGFLIYAAKHQS